jgi:hypothetical protein
MFTYNRCFTSFNYETQFIKILAQLTLMLTTLLKLIIFNFVNTYSCLLLSIIIFILLTIISLLLLSHCKIVYLLLLSNKQLI